MESDLVAAGDFDGDGLADAAASAGGSLDLTDAVAILLHLFAGGVLPPPGSECGFDSTPDGLTCSYPPCA